MFHRSFSSSKSGFTLVELLTVIGLLVIFVTLGFINFSSTMKNTRNTVRKTDITTMAKTYEVNYDSSIGKYIPLEPKNFTTNQIPTQPQNGGSYTGLLTENASGFNICAALEDNPAPSCDSNSPTCFCLSSQRGSYNSAAVAMTGSTIIGDSIPEPTPSSSNSPTSGDTTGGSSSAGSSNPTVIAKKGTEYSNRTDHGCWGVYGSTSVMTCIASFLDYNFNLPTVSNSNILVLETSNYWTDITDVTDHSIDIYVDGTKIGTIHNPATSPDNHQFGQLSLGSLAPGSHTIRAYWTNDYYSSNPHRDANLILHQITLQSN